MDWYTVTGFFTASVLPILRKILLIVLIYFVGKKVIGLALKLIKKAMERAKVEAGVETFLLSLIRILMYALLFFAILEVLDIATTTVVAVLGSAGLAVGLALQGSLANFAGGVLILVLKPYKVGDYIVACGEQGTVTEIDIFYTKMTTVDNKKIVIPNGTLSNSNIVNVSNEPLRRVDLTLPVAYDSDIKKVKGVLEKLAERNELVLKDKPADIFIDAFGDSSINFGFRMWTQAENYWGLKWQMMEEVKEAFDENGIEIPFNRPDVTINNEK